MCRAADVVMRDKDMRLSGLGPRLLHLGQSAICGLILIVGLSFLDAIPPRLIPQKVRLLGCAIISAIKSAAFCTPNARLLAPTALNLPMWLHVLKSALTSMVLYVKFNLDAAYWYKKGIPELIVGNFVVSSFDVLTKSCTVATNLSHSSAAYIKKILLGGFEGRGCN